MTSHAWTGFTIALSAVGLIVGVAADQSRDGKATSQNNVKVPQSGVTVLQPAKGSKVHGVVVLTQTNDGVRLRGQVRGLKPGRHGFHIHEFGDLRSPDGKSVGAHFNPDGKRHGGPHDPERHAGDLGNITADSNGTAQVDVLAKGLKLHFVVGRSIVVHADADDLKSQPSGNAGDRVALGVIGFAGPPAKNTTAK